MLSDNLILILFYEYYTTQDIVRKKYYLDRKYNTENDSLHPFETKRAQRVINSYSTTLIDLCMKLKSI